MRRRLVVNLLLSMFFSLLVATGIVLFIAPFFGIEDPFEQLFPWWTIHRIAAVTVLTLVCTHLYFNRRALVSYLRRARIRTILAFTLSAAALVSLVCLGISTIAGG